MKNIKQSIYLGAIQALPKHDKLSFTALHIHEKEVDRRVSIASGEVWDITFMTSFLIYEDISSKASP